MYLYDPADDRKLDDAAYLPAAGATEHGEPASTDASATTQSLAEISYLYGGSGSGAAELAATPDVDQLALHSAPAEPEHVDPAVAAVAHAEMATQPDHAADAAEHTDTAAEGAEVATVREAVPATAGPAHEGLPHAASTLAGAAQGLATATEQAPAAGATPAVAAAVTPAGPTTAPAPAAASAAAPEAAAPSWEGAARLYNEQHGLVAQFNAATHGECGTGTDADPWIVARWQTAHAVHPDGRIGHETLHAATQVARPATETAPATAEHVAEPHAAAKPAEPAAPVVAKPAAPTVAHAPAPTVAAPPIAKPATATAAPATTAATADSFIGADQAKGPGKDRWASYGKGDNKTYGWDVGGTHSVKHAGGDASAAAFAVSNVEGRYDSVQTYDAGILSFGVMQWTLHAGSLQKFLGFLKDSSGPEGRAAFQDDFIAKGIDVKPSGGQYQLWYAGKEYPLGAGGDGKAAIDKLVREDKPTARKWVDTFSAAGADPRVQKAEFERAKEMYREAQGLKFSDKIVEQSLKCCKNTFHAKYRDHYGKAETWTSASPKAGTLFFSMRVNNPMYANAAFLKAIDAFYDAHGTDNSKWPASWGDSFGALVADKSAETLSSWKSEGGGEGRVDKTLRFWNQVHGKAGSAPTAAPAAPAIAAKQAPAAKPAAAEKHEVPKTDSTLQTKLRAQYAVVMKQFQSGQVDQVGAVKSLIAYDQKLNGGSSSMACLVMLPLLLADLFKATTTRQATAKPAVAATPAAKPAVTAETKHAAPVPQLAPPAPSTTTAQTTVQPPATPSGEMFQKVYVAGGTGHFQSAQVFVSPGGLTTNKPDVFLHFHGHDAQYGIDKKQTQAGNISGLDVAGQAMAQAAHKNTVALFPQGVIGGGHHNDSKDRSDEGGFMTGLKVGLPAFLQSVLTPLGNDLGKGPLTPGNISIAGHSAGGYMGINDALTGAGDLADSISDITMMDTGYADWHFKSAAQWMVTGRPGKTIRIIGSARQIKDNLHGKTFGEPALEKLAHDKHMTVDHDNILGQKRDDNLTGVQHSRLKKDGAVQVDILVLMYDKTHSPTADHQPLRDEVIDDAMLSIGQGDKGSAAFGTHHQDKPDAHKHADKAAPAKPAPATHDVHAEAPKPAGHAEVPKPAGPNAAEKPAKAAPSGAILADHTHKGYDHKNGVDSFGNATESTRESNKHIPDANHRVFDNSFTTIDKAFQFTGPTTDAHLAPLLPIGTALHVLKVTETRAQIITPEITAEHNIWINFKNLGGKPTGAVALGNEQTDKADKERADALRSRLPSVCKPGKSAHSWKFGGNFKPSWNGVALDSSLMSKVVTLMNWAIANDMVTRDIVIGEGVRDPAHAHFMSLRYWIGVQHMPERVIDKAALRALKGGKDADGTQWYQDGWTDEQIIANAMSKYDKGSSGKVAAAGYQFGDPRRAPLQISGGQGVSAHCSGHAVDVDIPWRSEKDPEKGTDLWGWEEIYHQFGLTRPLHRDRGGQSSMQESWHIEETGKALNLVYDEETKPQ